MPVYKMDKLPPHHPFAQGLIVFGFRRPTASTRPSPVWAERIDNAPRERLTPASTTRRPLLPAEDPFETKD